MTTDNKTQEAAKALESFGWALVKYAQKVRANNIGMAHKWWRTAMVRKYTAQRLRREAWGSKPNRKFKAGLPPRSKRKIDVFVPDFRDRIYFGISAWVALDVADTRIKSWRYSI